MKWDLSLVADATAGIASGTAVVTSVSTDSRSIAPGALFVALVGEHLDGHDYLETALEAGAAAVVVERGRLPDGAAGVEVADTLEALIALAVRRRTELTMPVIAITGSSGKTTTKDLLAAALGPGTHASPESYNNEVGVPLTVLSCPDDATSLVIEAGSRGRGHIAMLTPAIRPDVAIITNIGRAHIEMFGDADAVLEAKWELVEALGSTGVAVLPVDDPRLVRRRTGRLVTFGERADADMAVSDIVLDELARPTFELSHDEETASVALSIAGRHQPSNAAAAVAAAVAIGRDLPRAAAALGTAIGSRWRMDVSRRLLPDGEIVVVNDAYNANPDSMRSALTTVAAMPGRSVAVLGAMLELGPIEAASHREMGALAASLGYDRVVVVGSDPGIAEGAGEVAVSVGDPDAAVAELDTLLQPGDNVLIKASRGVGLESVAGRIGVGT